MCYTSKIYCVSDNFRVEEHPFIRFALLIILLFVRLCTGLFVMTLPCIWKWLMFVCSYSEKRYYFRVLKQVLISRQKLLQASNLLPPGVNPKVPRLPVPSKVQQHSSQGLRTRARYFQQLRAVRQEVGESGHSSDDENYPGEF